MPSLPPILTSSLVMLLFVFGVVLLVWQGWIPGIAIYLEVKPEAAYQQNKKLLLPIKLILHNPSGQRQNLAPQDVCKIFRWFVLDEKTGFVQSAPSDPACTAATINRALSPWEDIEEVFILQLDQKRFEGGKQYFLFLKFWGFNHQLDFTAPF